MLMQIPSLENDSSALPDSNIPYSY